MPRTTSHPTTFVAEAATRTSESPVAARFAGRRRRSLTWRCPRPSKFAVLVVYELHDVALHLSGELDIAEKDAFDECVAAALEEHPRRLVLELSALEFTDVVGVGCFVDARARAEAADVDLILDSPNDGLRRLLDICGLTPPFRIR